MVLIIYSESFGYGCQSKLYESKHEELCVSFGLPFRSVTHTHKLLCTPKIAYLYFQSQGFNLRFFI